MKDSEQELGLLLPVFATSCRISINYMEIASGGEVGKSMKEAKPSAGG